MPDVKLAVIKNFSGAAGVYAAHARVQARVAQDLLVFSRPCAPAAVLELGCGTGLYTRLLAEAFPDAALTAVDCSPEMIRAARAALASPCVAFLRADAEALAGGRYDLITANAAFQWFDDLAGTMERLRGMLGTGGLISFSYFGPRTYRELQAGLRGATGRRVRLACEDFASPGEMRGLLAGLYRDCRFETRAYHEDFASLKDLLAHIKGTGTRGAPGPADMFWTRGLLRRVEAAYLGLFGRIRATYEVYLCRGRR